MNDRYDQQRLLDYLEQELSPADEAAFEAQLAGDPAMRRLAAQLRNDRALLRAAADQPAPAGLMERADAHIERQMLMGGLPQQTDELHGRRSAHIARWFAVGGLAAMLLLSAALLAWMLIDTGSLNDAAVSTLPTDRQSAPPAQSQPPAVKQTPPPALADRPSRLAAESSDLAAKSPPIAPQPLAMTRRSTEFAFADPPTASPSTANAPGAVEPLQPVEPASRDVIVRVPAAATAEVIELLTAWVDDVGGKVRPDQQTDVTKTPSLSLELPGSRLPDLLELLRGRQADDGAERVTVLWQAPRRGARVVMLEALHVMGMTAVPRDDQPLHVRIDFILPAQAAPSPTPVEP